MSIENEKHTELASLYQHVTNGGLGISIDRMDYDIKFSDGSTSPRTGLELNVTLRNYGVPLSVKIPASRAVLMGLRHAINGALAQCLSVDQYSYINNEFAETEVTVRDTISYFDNNGPTDPPQYSSGGECSDIANPESEKSEGENLVEDESRDQDEDGGDSIDNTEG